MKKDKIFNICVWWLIIDQIIKLFITMKMKLGQLITVIPNFFRIYYVTNDGAAFSSFSGMRYLLIIISLIVFFLLINYIKKSKITNKLEIIAIGLIMGGLVGNLVDRLLYGKVIDYLSFIIFGYKFAVFNFADIGIVIGAVIYIIYLIKSSTMYKKIIKKTRR